MNYRNYYHNQKRWREQTCIDASMMKIALEDKAERLGLDISWTVEIDYCGMDDDCYGTIERSPVGMPFLDYVPMLDCGSQGWTVKGYSSEYGDKYGYVPNESWDFEERRSYFSRLGMSESNAWLQAKEALADEAQQYIDINVFVVGVECGEYSDYLGGIYATEESEALTYFLNDYSSELAAWLDEQEQEQNELAHGQVGPVTAAAL